MPLLLLGSTLLLLAIIYAGGLWLRKKEIDYRKEHEPQDPKP